MEEESDDEVLDEKDNDAKARNKRRVKAPVYVKIVSLLLLFYYYHIMLFVTDLKATQKLYNSYIQDLITYLKDDEDPVKLDIGLSSAERLICNKTNVGAELSKSISFSFFLFP